MKKHFFLICFAFALTLITRAFGQDALLWDPTTGIRDLGRLGDAAFAYAVNDSGTVVGIYAPNDGRIYYHGFIWTEETGMVDIGVPGGGDSDTAEVFCYAINNAGNVVGSARQVDGRQVAFFWSPTDGFTALGNFSSRADNGNVAYAINDLDQVTGNLLIGQGLIYHAFIWSPDLPHPRDLGVVDGAQYSVGLGINNLSRIAGGSLSTTDFVWEPMGWTKRLGMYQLGTVPGTVYSQAVAINDAGQIVGLDQTGTSDLAFYTAPGIGLKFLKGLGGNEMVAHAINQSGVIVGYADDSTNAIHAVRWLTPTSVPEVFAPEMSNALGINSLGQIVGF
jgi:probable HAF family extracellular repeat protein